MIQSTSVCTYFSIFYLYLFISSYDLFMCFLVRAVRQSISVWFYRSLMVEAAASRTRKQAQTARNARRHISSHWQTTANYGLWASWFLPWSLKQGMPGSHCQLCSNMQQYALPNGHCHGHKHTQTHVILMVTAKFCTAKGALCRKFYGWCLRLTYPHWNRAKHTQCRPSLGLLLPAVHLGRILRPVQIRRPDDSANIFDLGFDQKPAEPLTIQVQTQVLNTTWPFHAAPLPAQNGHQSPDWEGTGQSAIVTLMCFSYW